jgi:hypothetical protein
MPPGWWVPVRGSDPGTRKQEVKDVVENQTYGGALHCFWQEHGKSDLFALITNVDDNEMPNLLKEEKVNYKGDGATKVKIL